MANAETIEYWDAEADRFDDEPDHGLTDPTVRAAWARRLNSWLPGPPRLLADLGCGTGSMALLAAEAGYRMIGVDASQRMARRAAAKLAGHAAVVLVGDAAAPPLRPHGVDVVLVRHVLWMLADPAAMLRRWAALVRPGGRLLLIEGRWGVENPAGISADTLVDYARAAGKTAEIHQLAGQPELWGRPVADERYAAIIDC